MSLLCTLRLRIRLRLPTSSLQLSALTRTASCASEHANNFLPLARIIFRLQISIPVIFLQVEEEAGGIP